MLSNNPCVAGLLFQNQYGADCFTVTDHRLSLFLFKVFLLNVKSALGDLACVEILTAQRIIGPCGICLCIFLL